MLYWTKFKYFSPLWNNYYSSWMLSCSSFDSSTSFGNSYYFCLIYIFVMFFIILFNIAKGCFFCNSSNGSCLKSCTFSKYNFCISMCFGLILTREIQIYIWFLISIKAKKGFKRYIHSIFIKFFTTYRTNFIRQVKTIFISIIIKIRIFTFMASIMWW